MKTVWRILRIVLYTLLIVVAGAIGALVVLTKTERGRDNLAGIISQLASTDDRKITVSGIDGIWSGNLSVDHVVLEDRNGAWLVARKVAVDWSPLRRLWSSTISRPDCCSMNSVRRSRWLTLRSCRTGRARRRTRSTRS